MISNEIEIVLKKVQINKASHQKNLKVLESVFNKVSQNDFSKVLLQYIESIFLIQNEYSERTLEFLAQFVSNMTCDDEPNLEISDDTQAHSFLTNIVIETLKYHNCADEHVRFNCCLFVRLILHYVGSKIQLDNTICDLIQDAMLDRTMDSRSIIRHQAVMALVRLQDPLNPECPVINAYLSLIVDGNPLIRAETVKLIAPYNVTIPHIIKRSQDVDANVRIMAFRRCADIGPKSFKIIERQHVLKCGLSEEHKKVKNIFVENLLVKWLNAYNRNFLDFFKALKLDADENDVITTEKITKDVMNTLLSTITITDIIAALPVNDNKTIAFSNLTSESVILWNVIVCYLRQLDHMEEYLDQILPELTHFCSFIDGYINFKKPFTMEEWQYLEYQQILYNLFEIAEGYDFSDEVGRKKIVELIFKLVKDETLQFRLLRKLLNLAEKLKSKNSDFITDICHIISEIREPLIERTVEQHEHRHNEFEMARLKVKLSMLESQLEDATDEKDFLKAHELEQEIIKIRQDLKELSVPPPVLEVAKVTKDDPKTLCRCLDILIALLQLQCVKELTPSLIAVKDEFLLPLLNYNIADVNWRVLNCLGLLCIIDKFLAEEYVKVLSIPIITYRAITNYNKLALITSVKAISDIFRIHGIHIFGGGSGEGIDETTNQINSTRRRLYRNDEDNSLNDPSRFHFESVIEIMLDMLDDESTEIRECSVIAIAKLIRDNFPVTPPFITRIILKWYNPLTGKGSDNLQPILGGTIGNYAHNVKGAKEILAKSVIPIISGVVCAPKTSPLADVDIDNLLKFLCVITNTGKDVDVVNTHLHLAHTLCHEILKRKNSPIVIHLTKMLLQLEIPTQNMTAIKELIHQIQIILEEIVDLDRQPFKNLKRIMHKLECTTSSENNSLAVSDSRETTDQQNEGTVSTINDVSDSRETADQQNEGTVRTINDESHSAEINENGSQNPINLRNGNGNINPELQVNVIHLEPIQSTEMRNINGMQETELQEKNDTLNNSINNGRKKETLKKRKRNNGKISSFNQHNNVTDSIHPLNASEERESLGSNLLQEPVTKKPRFNLRVDLQRINIRRCSNQSTDSTINSKSSFQPNAESTVLHVTSKKRKSEELNSTRFSLRLHNQSLENRNSFNGRKSAEVDETVLHTIIEEIIQTSSGHFTSNSTILTRNMSLRSSSNSPKKGFSRDRRKRSSQYISSSFSEGDCDSNANGRRRTKRKKK